MKENQSRIKASIKKAIIEPLLLKLLSEDDMYGYQITQEIKKRSNEEITILEGSMYPILYRLDEQGFISSYEKKVGKRLTRVYYHLEEEGKKYLKAQIEDFEAYIAIVNKLFSGK